MDGEVDEHCVCPVFLNHDCIASIEAFERDELIVSLTTTDRAELESIVDGLRAIGATPRLQQLTRSGTADTDRVLELEPSAITDKQREAVELAVEEGYYETPRQATLNDLANRLGISLSAVSQRLSSVETRLILTLFESQSGTTVGR